MDGRGEPRLHDEDDLAALLDEAFVNADPSAMRRHLAEPWRFSTRDYLESAPLGRVALGEPRGVLSASWDPGLVPAMLADGRRVFEERVLADLLGDLGS